MSYAGSFPEFSNKDFHLFIAYFAVEYGKHSKLKRVNHVKHKKKKRKKKIRFYSITEIRGISPVFPYLGKKKRKEEKKRNAIIEKQRVCADRSLSSPFREYRFSLIFAPLKAFHKAILFFDPQSRITRDLQETRWSQDITEIRIYTSRERDFHDLHVETILRRMDKGEGENRVKSRKGEKAARPMVAIRCEL